MVKISDIASVNYRDPALRDMPDSLEITFVPMAAVDEIQGKINTPEIKLLGEVRRGFTPFSEGDVIFAKITPEAVAILNATAPSAKMLRDFGFRNTSA